VTEVRASRLDPPVDPRRDHVLDEAGAEITLLEFGSYTCPYCHAAHEVIADLRDRFGERMRYVFRHRPTTDDADALRAAELAEFAHQTRGRFWDVHDALMKRGPAFMPHHFREIARDYELHTDDEAQAQALERARQKVREDTDSARRSGALFTPTFVINGRRYEGPWDQNSLAEAMLGSLGHRVQSAALDFARWAPSTGLLLLLMTLLAVALSNSQAGAAFEAIWNTRFGLQAGEGTFALPLRDWINHGLLTIFFLVVGLEIKREFTVGRLASRQAAALPVAGALGGMVVPALIYLLFVPAGPLRDGWAIPTATDTAFAVALIALLGNRVPVELRVFLTAAVVVDDLVAIAIVAVFYSGGLTIGYLVASLAATVLLIFLNRSGIYRALPYALVGIVLWACLHGAGLHATLAGVILALVTPTRPPPNLSALMAQAEAILASEMRHSTEKVLRHGPSEPSLRALDAIHDRIESPADKLLRGVEPWSSYVVLPVFALANAGFAWSLAIIEGHERLIAAITLGLVIGKPLGIVLASAVAVRLRLAVKSDAYSWRQLSGAGVLAGIGFTMSLFIASLALPDAGDFAAAKLAVLLSSLIAGGLGTALLWARARDETPATTARGRGRRGESALAHDRPSAQD
jgi:NhaA family Na+:H+ antiporter